MSDDDLIRRGDALYAIAGWEAPSTAIAALPAVIVREAQVNETPKSEHDASDMLSPEVQRMIREAEAEVEKLRAERDEWKAVSETLSEMWGGENQRAETAEAEVEKLRGALEKIANRPDYRLPKPQHIARAALKGDDHE